MRSCRYSTVIRAPQIEREDLQHGTGLERIGSAVLAEPGSIRPGGRVLAYGALLNGNGNGDPTSAVTVVTSLIYALSPSLCFDTTSWHIAMPSGVSGIYPISGVLFPLRPSLFHRPLDGLPSYRKVRFRQIPRQPQSAYPT